MAFTDPIAVNDNAAALQNFTRQAMNGFKSDWIETDATTTNIRRLVIQHGNAGTSVSKGQKPVRRHATSWIHEKYNATLGKMEKAVLNMTLTIDPGASHTSAEIYDLLAFAKNFASTTNIDKLLRDEI